MTTVISVENLSKIYRLGQIGTGTFANDLKIWWAKQRGRANPLSRIGEDEHGNREGENVWALKDVSFKVEQGEVLGVIGRNGAGKSTLLKILSRITAPTSGMVRVKGRIASLLEVGTGFHPELTGRENIYLNGAILGMNRAEITRKFDEIADFSGIEKFIDTPVKRYSSGMYVRLAFAVAAHLEPEILLVDEVLAVGDIGFQRKCLGKMGEVAKAGRTVLFVSHDMAQVTSLCKQGIWLDGGGIGFSGEIADTVTYYFQSFEDPKPEQHKKKNGFIGWKFVDGISSYTSDNNSRVTIQIEVGLKQNYPHGISNLILQTEDGLRISTLSYYGVKLPKGKVALQYPLERLPLVPGKYYVRAELWDPGKPIDIIIFPQPLIIVASDKDFLQTDSKKGIVNLKSELEVKQI